MTKHQVQIALDSGLRLGVTKVVDNPDFLGWILIRKHSFNPRLRELLDPHNHADILLKERRRELAPFQIKNVELNKRVHEAGGYETNEDYRLKEVTWCKDLDEVEVVLERLGVKLNDLCDSREIDAP